MGRRRRSQRFTYDELNRIATARTQDTTGPQAWGLEFGYDIWANLLSASVIQGSAPMLSVAVNTKNQISEAGFVYDAAGNLVQTPAPGALVMAYDAENRMTSAAGVTYSYDGDGKRLGKDTDSDGILDKIYWYGMSADALVETDSTGANPTEYVFFSGKRIARRDPNGSVFYFFADHLGSARVVTNATGQILDDSDFYPFGGERIVVNNDPNPYKFTGKERDTESGLDNFGARYFASTLGRFMLPDEPFIDQHPRDPQSWNLYAYVRNNPLKFTDPTGEDCVYTQDFHSDGTVTVERGNCSQDGGTYVDGTIDLDSFVYNPRDNTLEFGYTTSEGAAAVHSLRLPEAPDPGLMALQRGALMAEPGVNFAATGLRIFASIVAPPLMAVAECGAGAPSCTADNVALAMLPGIGKLREGATLLKTGAAVGRGAEILQKSGGMAQAAKDFAALQGAEKAYGATKVKTLSDGTKAVLYHSKSGAPTIALQDAAGRTVTKIRY